MKKRFIGILTAAALLVPMTVTAAFGLGDRNPDGVLNGFDLALMKRDMENGEIYRDTDLDNDGSLTHDDIAQMQDFLMGRIDYFDGVLSGGSIQLTGTASVGSQKGTRTDAAFTAAQMNFAAELFRQTAVNEQNTMISPISVMLALSMTANGADGETLTQMEEVLGDGMSIDELNNYLTYYISRLPDGSQYKLRIADSIWYRDDETLEIFDDFLNRNISFYDAEIYKAPFNNQTVKDVNLWVKKKTDGMIPGILKELDDTSMMVLINAVSFDAEWREKYYTYNVTDETFTNVMGVAQPAEMLNSTEDVFYDFSNALGFSKPYAGGYSFVAILPEEGMTVSEWIAQMDSTQLQSVLAAPQTGTVYAKIPKFSYSTDLNLNEQLQKMGLIDAFGMNADFSKMGLYNGEPTLYIGSVNHSTKITLDENGTKAAAVTSVDIAAGAAPPENIQYIYLDRPFVYMIVENQSNLPIFMGTVQSLTD